MLYFVYEKNELYTTYMWFFYLSQHFWSIFIVPITLLILIQISSWLAPYFLLWDLSFLLLLEKKERLFGG